MKKYISILSYIILVVVASLSVSVQKVPQKPLLSAFSTGVCEMPEEELGGSLCLSVKDFKRKVPTNCSFDFLQLSEDPQPLATSVDGCDGYYLPKLPAGNYDVYVTCGKVVGMNKVLVSKGEERMAFILLPEPLDDGSLCIGKKGLPIDLDSPVASIQPLIGFGRNGACKGGNKLAVYKIMHVTAISGPNCKGLNDPNCPVRPVGNASDPLIEGEFQHLLWTADFSKLPKESDNAVYKLTIDVGGAQTVDVYLDVLRDFFVES